MSQYTRFVFSHLRTFCRQIHRCTKSKEILVMPALKKRLTLKLLSYHQVDSGIELSPSPGWWVQFWWWPWQKQWRWPWHIITIGTMVTRGGLAPDAIGVDTWGHPLADPQIQISGQIQIQMEIQGVPKKTLFQNHHPASWHVSEAAWSLQVRLVGLDGL